MPGGIWAIDDPRNRLPLGTDKVRAGIGGLLDDYVRNQDLDREERNRMAEAGATRLPDEQGRSPLDRIRGMLPAILGGRRGAITPMQPRAQPTPGYNPQAGAPVPLGGRSISDMLGEGGGPDVVPSREDAEAGNVARETRPMAGAMAPDQPATAAARDGTTGIGSLLGGGDGDIPPVMLEGRGGSRYSVDPMRNERIKVAGARMEQGVKTEAQRGEQERQIQALVEGGMTPQEARARVLTGTVKYDEEYGPQKAKPLTYEQRIAIENLKGDKRIEAIRVKGELDRTRSMAVIAARANNPNEVARLRLREQELDVRLNTLLFNIDKSGTTEKIPQGVDRTIQESTPEGKAAISGAEQRVGAARTRVAETRERVKDKIVKPSGGSKPKAADRAAALKKAGKTTAQIYQIMKSEGYNVVNTSSR